MAQPNIVNVTSILGETATAELNTTLTTSLLANGAASNKVYKVNNIIVANKDGTSDAAVTISHYDGSNDRYLASTVTVPADATLIVLDKNTSIYLEEGHSVRGGASANGDLDVVISYEIIDDA